MRAITAQAVSWTESGILPDTVIRAGIRRLLESKRKEIHSGDIEYAAKATNRFVEMMNESPIALLPEIANEQHYEVPAGFFTEVMGDHRKYSCCYWPAHVGNLSEAEVAALELTVKRAGIQDGMKVLDLGCGWGSLSFWIAEHFPNSSVTSVSNSTSQRDFILKLAGERSIENIDVVVCDMNDFSTEQRFDRVVSIEMFEHMRNYGELFRRIDNWLLPDGRFFMHVFCHRTTPYEYIDKGPADWMSRHFFSGGIMPSADLPLRFAENLCIVDRWHWNGQHYAKTCNAWLKNMDQNESRIMPILVDCYGEEKASLWWQRWRIFFMACAELFDYDDGSEWFVGHYLFKKAPN
ncbi:MAG: cyclopropane-fatty-acyl-phospholipid synthase family protein [Gammaproteobacteria bacterium]|nr:cyclopropane-fatty-acyl-phospholipid synthase family protein [Gammaproteobacteria bacterium]MDH5582796.1 cyclopropane-fatty-acyl-phospholipid synthase family protein [Gammaproteobacteria bacterium]